MPDIHADRILILDFGAQYTQLIARRVRELGVYSEIYACDAAAADIRHFRPKAVILSGGPESVYAVKGPEAPPERLRSGRPGARHLLRHANHGCAARRPGGAIHASRIRRGAGEAHRRLAPARWSRGQSRCRRAACTRCLDEPWRSGRCGTAGIQCHCRERQRAAGGHGR